MKVCAKCHRKNVIMRALIGTSSKGWRYRWDMATACYAYSRGHGLTRCEALGAAAQLWWTA